ncbi:MAG: exodeoxyribonuclease VII small subunit [bacterium]
MNEETTPSTAASADAGAAADAAANAGDDDEALDFETALAELEDLVTRMEAGDMTLEASLAAFERGVKLTRHCQAALRDAELKVKKLTEDDQLEDLDTDALDDD